MKLEFLKLATMAAATICLFTFGTCEDEDEPDSPTPPSTGSTFSISPRSLSFPAEGGSESFTLNTGNYKYYGVYVEEDEAEDWLKLSSKSSTKCTFTATTNTTGEPRYAHIIAFVTDMDEIESLDDTKYYRIDVTQAANRNTTSIILDLEKYEVEYDYREHKYQSIKFTTNTELTVDNFKNVSDVNWIEMYYDGFRDNTVTFDLKKNDTANTRVGHITVTIEKNGAKVEKTITVTQRSLSSESYYNIENFSGLDVQFTGHVFLTRTWLESGEVENLQPWLSHYDFIDNSYWVAEDWNNNPWKLSSSKNSDGTVHLEQRWDNPAGNVHFELTADIDNNAMTGKINSFTFNRQIDYDDGRYVHTAVTCKNATIGGHASKEDGSEMTLVETTHDAYGMVYVTTGPFGRAHVDHVITGVAKDDWYLRIYISTKNN